MMQNKDYESTIDKTDGNGTAPATVPAPQLVNPFALFAQRNRGGGFFKGDLIKLEHTTGEFFRVRGEAKTLVEHDEQLIANPHELTDTWTKWVNGKIVERRAYRTANGEMAPTREELGDLDENYWPTRGKKPKDPWQRASISADEGQRRRSLCLLRDGPECHRRNRRVGRHVRQRRSARKVSDH